MTPLAKQYRDRIVEAWERGADSILVDLYDELNTSETWEMFLEVWGALPSTMRRQYKELVDRGHHTENYDPTPWCHICGARKRSQCTCGPRADND